MLLAERNFRRAKRSANTSSTDHHATVLAIVDTMSKADQRELLIRALANASTGEIKQQQAAFEAHLAEHASEIEPSDEPEIADMRQIYVNALASKEFTPSAEQIAAKAAATRFIARMIKWPLLIAISLLILAFLVMIPLYCC